MATTAPINRPDEEEDDIGDAAPVNRGALVAVALAEPRGKPVLAAAVEKVLDATTGATEVVHGTRPTVEVDPDTPVLKAT